MTDFVRRLRFERLREAEIGLAHFLEDCLSYRRGALFW